MMTSEIKDVGDLLMKCKLQDYASIFEQAGYIDISDIFESEVEQIIKDIDARAPVAMAFPQKRRLKKSILQNPPLQENDTVNISAVNKFKKGPRPGKHRHRESVEILRQKGNTRISMHLTDLYRAKILFNFRAAEESELSVKEHDVVIVERNDEGWSLVRLGEKRGWVPFNYIKPLSNQTRPVTKNETPEMLHKGQLKKVMTKVLNFYHVEAICLAIEKMPAHGVEIGNAIIQYSELAKREKTQVENQKAISILPIKFSSATLEQYQSNKNFFSLARKMFAPGAVPTKNRHWRLKTYKNSFVGKEAVTWLVDQKIVPDRQSAVIVGEKMRELGVFDHVLMQHSFKDEYLFYCVDQGITSSAMIADENTSTAAVAIPVASKKKTIVPINSNTSPGTTPITNVNSKEKNIHFQEQKLNSHSKAIPLDSGSSVKDVKEWMLSMPELAQYADVFEKNEINGQKLHDLMPQLGKKLGLDVKDFLKIHQKGEELIQKEVEKENTLTKDDTIDHLTPLEHQEKKLYTFLQQLENAKGERKQRMIIEIDKIQQEIKNIKEMEEKPAEKKSPSPTTVTTTTNTTIKIEVEPNQFLKKVQVSSFKGLRLTENSIQHNKNQENNEKQGIQILKTRYGLMQMGSEVTVQIGADLPRKAIIKGPLNEGCYPLVFENDTNDGIVHIFPQELITSMSTDINDIDDIERDIVKTLLAKQKTVIEIARRLCCTPELVQAYIDSDKKLNINMPFRTPPPPPPPTTEEQ